MATIYDVEFGLCSPFCAYSEQELKEIITKLFKDYRNLDSGLGFDPLVDLEVKREQ